MSPKKKAGQVETPINHYPAWGPRFWHGMRTACWWRLLAQNRFRVALARCHVALGVSLFSPVNDLLAMAQAAIYGRKIAKTRITKAPIFILGHWRSGTTLLHELLVKDSQFASPNTFQCFAPSHFLLSEFLMVRLGGFLLPKQRPMDNMEAGWLLPQEDEFALMTLGLPTPYLRIAFPRTQPKLLKYLGLTDLSHRELETWRRGFTWFLQVLTYHYGGKQLVLKSPTHTGRIGELAKMFPDAKFIHLTRDPAKLFPSTLRLWRSLDDIQALQPAADQTDMKRYVGDCLTQMYEHFESARLEIEADRIVDISYEQLIASPFETVRMLYETLDLGDFRSIEASLRERLADHADYQPNQHSIDDELRQEVFELWPHYSTRYGYQTSDLANEVVASTPRS